MKRTGSVAVLVAAMVLALPAAGSADLQTDFNTVVNAILAQPYQPNYVPMGLDTAFPPELNVTPPVNPAGVPNTAPAQDYTSGSIPGSADHPEWPTFFKYERYVNVSSDNAPLRARIALHPGSHPGIVVVHGFNTNGKESVIRWAAMLYKNGYNVIASDQRDFRDEVRNPDGSNRVPSDGYPDWLQTFGWKEATDVLAAGQYLKSKTIVDGMPVTVTSLGVMGFSLGAQDTVLAMALDPLGQVFNAGLTFSGPADQNAQIYSTAAQAGCQPPNCTYPATDALIALVVPPYGNGGKYTSPCTGNPANPQVLDDAAAKYGVTPAFILSQLKAYQKQQQISVPLLNFYSNDDSLVQPFHATMMNANEQGKPLQRTYLIDQGEHAYFFDRWWQQAAALIYFKGLLAGAATDPSITLTPTVNQTPGDTTMDDHRVAFPATPAPAPVICPGPTAVALRSFSADRSGTQVVLRWHTGSEAGLAGFNVYAQRAAGRVRLNRVLVRPTGDVRGHSYVWRGRVARPDRFWLEIVRLDGSRTWRTART